MRLVFVMLALLVGTASAGTPQVRIGAPLGATITHARFEVNARGDHTHALLTLAMTSESETRVNCATMLHVPRGTRVVGMSVSIGDGPSSAATAMSRSVAAERYRAIRGIERDPGLVEWEGSHDRADRYSVNVFPIVRDTPARITVEMELSATRRVVLATDAEIPALELVNASTAHTHTSFSTPLRIALPKSTTAVVRVPRVAVSNTTSLFADEPGRLVMPDGPTLADQAARIVAGDTEAAVEQMLFRRTLRTRTAALRRCGASGGRVDIRFAVLPSGKVSAISVDGDGTARVKQCITDELATWTFRESENVVMVSEPVVLR